MEKYYETLDKNIAVALFEKLVQDPVFILWLKTHYDYYIEKAPLEMNPTVIDDRLIFSALFKYRVIIKKKTISLRNKLDYYARDFLLRKKGLHKQREL